jgi:purine-nucleoside phosphorylase
VIDPVAESAAAIAARFPCPLQAGLILGTGLGALAERMDTEVVIPYRQTPHFPCSTAIGHKGQLRLGRLSGTPVIVMEGRCHAYEGYSMEQITLPVRVMHYLGVKMLIVTCASGALHVRLRAGDVVVLEDHLNWTRLAALTCLDVAWPAVRCAAARVYDRELIERAQRIACREGFDAPAAVYAAMIGPNYETRAEYRMLRRIGADVVGMSTLPEASVAACLGLKVLGLSVVTNVARPDAPRQVQAEDVVCAAEQSAPKIGKIVLGILDRA